MKLRSISTLRLACLVALAVSGEARASPTQTDSFRCRNDLVSVGDRIESVRSKCGEPSARERTCRRDAPDEQGGIAACRDVERWTYRPGYGQFVTTLSFDDGTLVEITYGDRVP